MQTITPTPAHTVELSITLTSPLHHGAGSSGNTSLLRTHEVTLPDGTHTRVPFVSANSVRHGLRDALAWHTAETLRIKDGTLSKGVVDLLWSGGAVTTTGAQTNLDLARRVEETYPALGLLGYAAQSDITAGTMRVSDLEIVCLENAHRLPEKITSTGHAKQRAAAYRTEEFGTRHDISSTPAGRLIDAAREATGTQMIYSIQALKTGTMLHGAVTLTPAATPAHHRILDAAITLWAPGGVTHLAAKTAVGYGRGHLDYTPGDGLDWWTTHLTTHRDEIMALLVEIVG